MKKAVIILLVVFIATTVHAQRYIPGMSGVNVTLGISEELGLWGGVDYSVYTKKKNRWVFGVEYLQNSYEYSSGTKIPLSQLSLETGYYVKFLSDASKTFFLSVGASAMAGYETINWGKKLLPDGATIMNADHFLYGAALTMEAEYYLSDQHVLLFNLRERALGGSTVGAMHTQVGIGLKFILE
ncbi:MAG: conjugal transfer protein TraO [Prevotellaceae bacterium]|jgi:hypothetical protein|nr:conjugal transfer protein TraO [Prevotellaceae bacterium]